jgi:hypothetical protein
VQAQYLQIGNQPMEFWEWDGPGSVRVVLTLRQNDVVTGPEFVVTREKK